MFFNLCYLQGRFEIFLVAMGNFESFFFTFGRVKYIDLGGVLLNRTLRCRGSLPESATARASYWTHGCAPPTCQPDARLPSHVPLAPTAPTESSRPGAVLGQTNTVAADPIAAPIVAEGSYCGVMKELGSRGHFFQETLFFLFKTLSN